MPHAYNQFLHILTADEKLKRIENRIEIEEDFSNQLFKEYEILLNEQLKSNKDRGRVLSILANHSSKIDFYKEVIALDNSESQSALPYYYLIDNLLADNRTVEAEM